MLIFEAFIQLEGSRAGPIFSTSDRVFAWEAASIADRSLEYGRSAAEVVMTMVDDGCILNDVPDWRHEDFRRPKCQIPIKD